ncbi:ProQ/FINO family protein [Yersinia pekkanenii]|uniref:Conjugal transfer fertility inhibition protein FinO n=1 Tax=Yersinia pekkanenii TaxID=1288385 RepID=A0ABP1ZXB3_9GAMM|nr:ProQ/FINO family protein [Yersinia pekkanenii]CRY69645.1 conjugal transfer fertility inhibition protein FinO [Yersinia pekkanenii]
MTGERKILTLKRKSPPDAQVNTGETPLILSRNKIRVEAIPVVRKHKKPVVAVVEKTAPPRTPKNETPERVVNEPKSVSPPKPPRMLPYDEAVGIMEGYWPGLFDGQQPRLMKVNIREDFYHDIERRALPLSYKVLRRCLRAITRSPNYLSQVLTDAPRYDLDGVAHGHVTGQEYQYTLERLAKMN